MRTAVGCDSSTGSSKASERNVCAFSSLKNEPKPDLAEERYGMNSRAFERPFGIEWISSRTTVEMWTGGLGRGTYIYHQSAEYPPGSNLMTFGDLIIGLPIGPILCVLEYCILYCIQEHSRALTYFFEFHREFTQSAAVILKSIIKVSILTSYRSMIRCVHLQKVTSSLKQNISEPVRTS